MNFTVADVLAAKQLSAQQGNIKPFLSSLPPKLRPTFAEPSRYKVAYGGRGSSKTRSFSFMSAVFGSICAAQGKTGVILCGREFQNSLSDSSFAEVKAAIESDAWLRSQWEIGRQFIRHVTGRVEYVFSGLRHNIESLKGKARILLAWVDEAEQVSETSWKTLIPTVREPGSEIWVTYNPSSKNSSTHKRFRENATPDMQVVELNWSDNPHFPAVLDDERQRDLIARPDDYAHIWQGGFLARTDAKVFANVRVQEFVSPLNATFRFGADWGFAVDPAVLLRGFIGKWEGDKPVSDPAGRCLFIDYEAYEVGVEVDAMPKFFDQVPRSRDFRITADTARPELVSYMRRHGFPKIIPATKGAGSIEDGISFLQSFDIIIHPRCVETATEFASYSYKIDKKTDEVLPFLVAGDDHTIDAARYMLEGLRRQGVAPKVQVNDNTRPNDRYARPTRDDSDEGSYYG